MNEQRILSDEEVDELRLDQIRANILSCAPDGPDRVIGLSLGQMRHVMKMLAKRDAEIERLCDQIVELPAHDAEDIAVEPFTRDEVEVVAAEIRAGRGGIVAQRLLSTLYREGRRKLHWMDQYGEARGENSRLRDALETYRQGHLDSRNPAWRCPAPAGGRCDCGAAEHNAAIDAALNGGQE